MVDLRISSKKSTKRMCCCLALLNACVTHSAICVSLFKRAQHSALDENIYQLRSVWARLWCHNDISFGFPIRGDYFRYIAQFETCGAYLPQVSVVWSILFLKFPSALGVPVALYVNTDCIFSWEDGLHGCSLANWLQWLICSLQLRLAELRGCFLRYMCWILF